MSYRRPCDCAHGFPLCACFEDLSGKPLLDRSRSLSSLAGWPSRVDPDEAARVIAEYGKPRVVAATGDPGCGCGCS